MISQRQILRKKSLPHIPRPQLEEKHSHQLKSKKSTVYLPSAAHTKRDNQEQVKEDCKKSLAEKKITKSLSKGKIHLKKSKSTVLLHPADQNINTLNHKKSVDRLSRPQGAKLVQKKKKTQKISRLNTQEQRLVVEVKKQGKSKSTCHPKKQMPNKNQFHKLKPRVFKIEKFGINQHHKKSVEINLQEKQFLVKKKEKAGEKSIPSQKVITKVKKNKCEKKQQKGPQYNSKLMKKKSSKNKKIGQVLEKSNLYSQVNHDFQEQISFLAYSGIRPQFAERPTRHSQQQYLLEGSYQNTNQRSRSAYFSISETVPTIYTQKHVKAAITIQKLFRGYIQRKYIQEAKFIIENIKKIQRFWRKCLCKKQSKLAIQKRKEQKVRQVSSSLITVKDLDETTKKQKQHQIVTYQRNFKKESEWVQVSKSPKKSENSAEQIKLGTSRNSKDSLKDIIVNLLNEEGLNENIKLKIRAALNVQEQQKEQNQKEQTVAANNSIPRSVDQSHEEEQHEQFGNTKEFYVKKKIDMEISSQKSFNSPMNLKSQFTSPANLRRMVSPKCLSSSLNKEGRQTYNKYFRSNKSSTTMLYSPNPNKNENLRASRSHSHSGSKANRQNNFNMDNLGSQAEQFKVQSPEKHVYNENFLQVQTMQIAENSPIAYCTGSIQKEDLQIFSPSRSEMETRRILKEKVKKFPTAFYLIEQFCLIITDYLREDQEDTQVFLEKMKGLKYYKIEKLLKQWQCLEFEQYWDDNEQFVDILIRQKTDRPCILSATEKKLILEYPSLRLFLHQNDYQDLEVNDQRSPQNAYVKFIFDVFEEALYRNYQHFNIKNLHLAALKEIKSDNDYLSIVLSEAMGSILRCAQMLCGSFQTEEMSEQEKLQKQLINQQRIIEMTNDLEQWDDSSCQVWMQLLVCKSIFDGLVQQIVDFLIIR